MLHQGLINLNEPRPIKRLRRDARDIRKGALALHDSSNSQAIHQEFVVGQLGSEGDHAVFRLGVANRLHDRHELLVDVDERQIRGCGSRGFGREGEFEGLVLWLDWGGR
jgi:hypothetical protein